MVANLWAADTTSLALMCDFYRRLAAGDDVATALAPSCDEDCSERKQFRRERVLAMATLCVVVCGPHRQETPVETLTEGQRKAISTRSAAEIHRMSSSASVGGRLAESPILEMEQAITALLKDLGTSHVGCFHEQSWLVN